MLKLINSELFKFSKKPSSIIMLIVIIILVLATGVFGKIIENPVNYTDNWKNELTEKNAILKGQNEETKHNTILVNNNLETIAINEYRIQNDIKPRSSLSAWTFTLENIPLLSVVGLLIIIVASGLVSAEFASGTIKLVMIRPNSRLKVILSKYVSLLIINVFLVTFLLLISLIVGALFFGLDGSSTLLSIKNGLVTEENIFLYLFRYYLLSALDICMVASFAFMLSTLFRNTALALGISLFTYLTGYTFTSLIAGKFDWAKYILFANTDLNMYFSGTIFLEGMTMSFSIIILSIYLLLFLGLALYSFKSRDIVT